MNPSQDRDGGPKRMPNGKKLEGKSLRNAGKKPAIGVAKAGRLLWILAVFAAADVRLSSRLMAYEGQTNAGERPRSGANEKATLRSASARTPDIPSGSFEEDSERSLLELANQSRKKAGVQPLKLDRGLSEAARMHAEEMLRVRQLSHRFDGELSLPERLAASTQLQLEQEGENVAVDMDAADGHRHLMLSPPHRENLLNGAYNVVGMAAIRSGERLYIVQDFGRALPNYSLAEVKEHVTAGVAQTRKRSKQARLAARDFAGADAAACSMAQEDKLGTAAVQRLADRYTVLSYTSLHPDELPAAATQAIAGRALRKYSVGACYARTGTYPTGVYWLVIALQ